MNLKIQKFAEGGTSSSAFFYQPLAMATTGVEAESDTAKLIKAMTAANKKSSNDEDKGKITDKDFLGLLKDINGLPSDILKLYTQAQNFWADPTNTGDTNYSNFAQMLTRISLQAKIAKFNKEVWDKSRDTMFTNHSENEMAITDQGGVVIQTSDGGIDTISVEKWKQNPYVYKTLTNADIMELRAQKLPGDNSILNIVNGSTSVEAITNKLQKILSNAQSSSVSSYISTDGFNTKSGLTVLKGLLQRGLDPTTLTMPGVYKYTTKENADQVANLLQYAWASLSTKEQTLLTARAGKNKKGVDYLLKLLATGNTSFNTNMEYQDQLNPDGTKKETPDKSKSSKSDGEDDYGKNAVANQAYMMQTGRGGTPQTYTFQPTNGGASMTLYGRFYGGLQTPKGEIVGESSLSKLLQTTGIQALTNPRSIYFGDQKINDLNSVAYLNDGGMQVILPAIKDGSGNVIPNFAVLDDYQKAKKEIENNLDPKDPMYMKKQAAILSKYPNLRSLLIDGQPDPSKWSSFIVVNGETSEKVVGEDVKYAKELESDNAGYDQLSNILFPDGKGGHQMDAPGYGTLWNDNLYEAPVFIPVVSYNPGDTLILSSKFNKEDTQQINDLVAAKSTPYQNSSSNLLQN